MHHHWNIRRLLRGKAIVESVFYAIFQKFMIQKNVFEVVSRPTAFMKSWNRILFSVSLYVSPCRSGHVNNRAGGGSAVCLDLDPFWIVCCESKLRRTTVCDTLTAASYRRPLIQPVSQLASVSITQCYH